MWPEKLSEHLTKREFIGTQHRQFLEQQEHPPQNIIAQGIEFAQEVFEPARAIVGPLSISSGYRCPELNTAIGGSKTSAHMSACAVDCYPLKMRLSDAYLMIAYSDVPFDQIIYEYGRWIHLGGPKPGMSPRKQLLMIFEMGKYLPFDKNDPRVI